MREAGEGRAELEALLRRGMVIRREDFKRHDLSSFDFSSVQNHCTFMQCELINVRFSGNDLPFIEFHDCDLGLSKFNECRLLGVPPQISVTFLRTTFMATSFAGAILPNARFIQCDLRSAKFMGAAMPGARFEACLFHQTDFTGAVLNGANFSYSRLSQSRFTDAALRGASLRSSSLSGVHLEGADLEGADLEGADLGDVVSMTRSNLYAARLDRARLPSGYEPPRCFVCHSSEDKPFAQRLAADLSHAGVHVWIDEAELKPGDSLMNKIQEGVQEADHLLLLLSEGALGRPWVSREVKLAIELEKASGREDFILPVSIDGCSIDSAPELGERLWADASKGYEHALGGLLRTLARHHMLLHGEVPKGPPCSGCGTKLRAPDLLHRCMSCGVSYCRACNRLRCTECRSHDSIRLEMVRSWEPETG